jgi:hypothetical protein
MFLEHIAALIAASSAASQPEVTEAFRATSNGAAGAGVLDDAESLSVLAEAVPQLPHAPGAGLLAFWLGGAVESGAAPELLIPPLLQAYRTWTATVRVAAPLDGDDSLDEVAPYPIEPALDFGLRHLTPPLVVCLARSAATRRALSDDANFRSELQSINHISATWLETLLDMESGELVVDHVESGKGAVIGYRNIANAFHLFTLLQHSLAGIVPGARAADPGLLASALGESDARSSDDACWHYGRGDVPTASIEASIWGERTLREIPQINGSRVVLLWPPILSGRSWDSGFFHPRIDAARAEIGSARSLTSAEATHWRLRLGLPLPRSVVGWRWPWN